MNGVIEFLVEYFRGLSNEHPDVNGYLTGEKYDSNLSNQEYPVFWLRYPITGTMNLEYIGVTVNLACYTNTLKDEFDNEVPQNEATTTRPANQITYTSMLPSDAMMERCLRIMGNMIVKLKNDSQLALIPVIVDAVSFETKSRVFGNDVTGVEATLKLRIGNPYKCEVDSLFTL